MIRQITHKDWKPNEVKAELTRRSLSLRGLSRANGLHADTLRDALRRPYPKAERIIADAIDVSPHFIWPSRYLPDGAHKGGRARQHNSTPRREPGNRESGNPESGGTPQP